MDGLHANPSGRTSDLQFEILGAFASLRETE
jgi:hypothetical protein